MGLPQPTAEVGQLQGTEKLLTDQRDTRMGQLTGDGGAGLDEEAIIRRRARAKAVHARRKVGFPVRHL